MEINLKDFQDVIDSKLDYVKTDDVVNPNDWLWILKFNDEEQTFYFEPFTKKVK